MEDSTTLEAVAIAYLRPYCEQWVSPMDIMALPPAQFEGYTIQMGTEDAVCLTDAHGQAVTLSLRRLIPLTNKTLGRREAALKIPRDLARDLLFPYVKRGDSLESLHGFMGSGWYGYDVAIGGSYWKNGKFLHVDGWYIVVSEFEGEACTAIFSLKEIYDDLTRELKQGYTVEQPALL